MRAYQAPYSLKSWSTLIAFFSCSRSLVFYLMKRSSITPLISLILAVSLFFYPSTSLPKVFFNKQRFLQTIGKLCRALHFCRQVDDVQFFICACCEPSRLKQFISAIWCHLRCQSIRSKRYRLPHVLFLYVLLHPSFHFNHVFCGNRF